MPATGLAQARLRALSFTSPLGLPPLLPSPSLAARRGNGHPPHVVLAYRDVEPGVHHGSARSRRGVQSGSPAGVVQRAAVPAAIRVGPPAAAGGGAGGRACRAPAGRELQGTAPRGAAAGCRAARCGGVRAAALVAGVTVAGLAAGHGAALPLGGAGLGVVGEGGAGGASPGTGSLACTQVVEQERKGRRVGGAGSCAAATRSVP